MGPLTQSLCSVLMQITELLRKHGEEHWGTCIERDLNEILAGDYGGLEDLLSAYGGMGSFNDLILHPVNGHDLALSQVETVNNRLAALRSEAWQIASEIRRVAVLQEP